MWYWILTGLLCVILGMLIMVTDWIFDTSEPEVTSRSTFRTYAELEPNITSYYVGRDLVDKGTWSSIKGASFASNHLYCIMAIQTIETNPDSGNHYIQGISDGNVQFNGLWDDNIDFTRGYTAVYLVRHTDNAARYGLGGSIENFVYYDGPNMTLLGKSFIASWLDEAGDPFTMAVGEDYGLCIVFGPNSADITVNVYVFDITGALKGRANTILTGTSGQTLGRDGGWIKYSVLDGDTYLFGQMYVDDVCDQSDCQSLVKNMLYQTYWASISFPTITLYKNNATDRTATQKGTPSSFSAVNVPPSLTFDASTCRIHGTPDTVGTGSFTVTVDGLDGNDYDISYEVLPEPTLVYPSSFIVQVGTAVQIVPTIQSVSSVDATSVTLPAGLTLATEDVGEITAGTIYGIPTEATSATDITIQYTLPVISAADGVSDPDLSLSAESNVSLRLTVSALPIPDAPPVTPFSYGTSETNPLICVQSFSDRYFDGSAVREFVPTQNTEFYQFLGNLPSGLSVDEVTGAIKGMPDKATDGVVTVNVFGTHMVTGQQFSAALHLKVVQNMSVLQYNASYEVPTEEEFVVEPSQADGYANSIELSDGWPSGATAQLDGRIILRKGSVTKSFSGLGVTATSVDRVLHAEMSLVPAGSSSNSTLKYVTGSGVCVVGAGLIGWGIYDLNRGGTVKQ
jgi:hypothetical protein